MMNGIRYPRCFELGELSVNDFSELEARSHDVRLNLKSPDFKATEACNLTEINSICQTRSLKKNLDTKETSFEETFMSEHSLAFQKNAQKLIELLFGQHGTDHQGLLSTALFGDTKIKTTPEFILAGNSNLINQSRLSQFACDLKTEAKLNQFLKEVCDLCYSDCAEELIALATDVYEIYIKEVQGQDISYEKLKALGQKFAHDKIEGLMHSDAFTQLNFRETARHPILQPSQMREPIMAFLQFFAETVLLVTCEYFTNPYYEPTSFKRPRSFGQEEDCFGEEDDDFEGFDGFSASKRQKN